MDRQVCLHIKHECTHLPPQHTRTHSMYFIKASNNYWAPAFCQIPEAWHLAPTPVCAVINKGKQSSPLVSHLIVLKERTSSRTFLKREPGNPAEVLQLALRMWKPKVAKRSLRRSHWLYILLGDEIAPICINTRLKTQHQDKQTPKLPQQLKPNHLLPTGSLPHDYEMARTLSQHNHRVSPWSLAGQWDCRVEVRDSGYISMLALKMISVGFALKSKLF